MKPLSEKEIIIKIKNGEIDFFRFIVESYSVKVYRYIFSKLRHKEDSEDLTQNAFIKLYRSLDRFDVGKPLAPYLYTIVNNELKMWYRSRKQTYSLNDDIETPSKQPFDEGEISDIYTSLAMLKKQEKEALLLISEGYSYNNVADKLKKPVNTVKSIVRRARITLKKTHEKS